MAHFDKDYLDFFKDLDKNNNKDWFHANKKRYEKSIKNPFKGFVEALSLALQDLYPGKDLSDKIQITRINRDIRFSKDKTPYKTHMAAMIMPHGLKDYSKPGLYIEATTERIRVYSGAHDIEKNLLKQVRHYIADNMEMFRDLVNDKNFKSTFGEVLGEKHKRLDPDLRGPAEKEPLIFNKQFYWFFDLPAKAILNENIVEEVIDKFRHTMKFNSFLEAAMGVN